MRFNNLSLAVVFHDYAVVYDSVAETTSFFVDGGLVHCVSGDSTPDTDAYQLGAVHGGIGSTWFANGDGAIDDLRVYQEALTAADLTALSFATLPFCASNAVAISVQTQRGTMVFEEDSSLTLNVINGLIGPFLSVEHLVLATDYQLPVTVTLPDRIVSGTYTLLTTSTEGLSADSFDVTFVKPDVVTSAVTSWDAASIARVISRTFSLA